MSFLGILGLMTMAIFVIVVGIFAAVVMATELGDGAVFWYVAYFLALACAFTVGYFRWLA